MGGSILWLQYIPNGKFLHKKHVKTKIALNEFSHNINAFLPLFLLHIDFSTRRMPLHKKLQASITKTAERNQAMNEKEKKEFYVANCKCCLLAEALKTCPVCRFNIGLAEKQKPDEAIPVSLPLRIDLFSMSEQQ